MSTNDIRSPQLRLHRLVVAVLLAVMFINIFPTSASAANNKTDVVGKYKNNESKEESSWQTIVYTPKTPAKILPRTGK